MNACMFLRRILADRSGVSVVEFAIGAPLLIFALLMMVDVAGGITMRMDMDRSVRAGAQAAMSLINDTAIIRDLVLESAGDSDGLAVDVALNCRCGSVATACTTACASGDEASVFIEIAATRRFSGMLFGDRELVSSTSLQVR